MHVSQLWVMYLQRVQSKGEVVSSRIASQIISASFIWWDKIIRAVRQFFGSIVRFENEPRLNSTRVGPGTQNDEARRPSEKLRTFLTGVDGENILESTRILLPFETIARTFLSR